MTGFSAIPLVEQGGSEHQDAHLTGVARILGPRWAQLPAITIGLLGVQVFWSVEMSYGTPYLLSLGLSKAAVAMVFLAGPISGLLVQPLIGILADNSKSRFGRRRPYMITGCIICIAAMLLLGFTRPFASLFLHSPSIPNDILTIWLAIVALFIIDFSINAVQAVDRALIIDTLPSAEQADANAWAARMLGFGSVAGYFIGNVDMTAVFPFLGDTELEVLAVVGSFLLLLTHGITAFCTKEKVIVSSRRSNKSFVRELREIWENVFTLPPVIRQICMIQFFSWVGWFPVLFYTSAFIGDLHKRSSSLPASHPDLDAEATRLGTRALFYSALLSFAGNILLPFIVAESARTRRLLERKLAQARENVWARMYDRVKVNLVTLWAASHLLFAVCMLATFFYSSVAGATFFTTLTGFSWSITQWAPFSLLAEAILTEPAPGEGGTIVLNDTRTHRRSIAFAGDDHERQFLVGPDEDDEGGVSRPLAQSRPHEELDDETHKQALQEDMRSFSSDTSEDADRPHSTSLEGGRLKPHSPSSDGNHDEDDIVSCNRDVRVLLHHASAPTSRVDVHSLALSESATLHGEGDYGGDEGDLTSKASSGLAAKAGIIIGIHNVFIVIPQFIMTGFASIIFALLDPASTDPDLDLGRGNSTVPDANSGVEGELLARGEALASGSSLNSYAIIYRLGGLSAAVAFVLTLKLARELRHH